MANFSQGAQVEHQRFGLGAVISSTDERIGIKFDDHGEKKFVTSMVIGSLKKSDRQPPADKKASRARAKKDPLSKAAPVVKDLAPMEALESDAFISDAFTVDPFGADGFGNVGFDDEIAVAGEDLADELADDAGFDHDADSHTSA